MNLASIIETHPEQSVALISGANKVTYGELRQLCGDVRGGLLDAGVKPGDRVAIVLPTGIDFVVSYLAVLGVGAVAVPLNPHSPPPEIARELATVRPVLVIGSGDRTLAASSTSHAAHPSGAAPAGPAGPVGPQGGSVADLTALGYVVTRVGELAEGATGRSHPPVAEAEQGDTAVLVFTSGTAGFPKAAVLTHGSLSANLEQMELRAGLDVSPNDVGLLVIPIFHIFGLNGILGLNLFVGGSVVLVERFEPMATLRAIEENGVTVVSAVPSVFAAWADTHEATGGELRSVRIAISGAAALSEEVAGRFEERFGVRLWQGYGLTEASPAVAFADVSRDDHRPGSVGTPLPGIEVKIVDVDGEEVEHGDPGELLVRGPNVFSGYFEDPGATAHVLDRAGWLHTGDVAVMSDDALLTLVDRRKDLVIVSGFNVYPAEVEEVLGSHPDVADVAVVGTPDPTTGESIRAFVVPAAGLFPEDAQLPDRPTEADLIAYCAAHLARYKCPSSVSFVRELPRGIAGKPLRRALV